MSGDRHSRCAAATGVFFVVLAVIGFLAQPPPPAADASAAEVLEYVRDHHNALHLIQVIFALALFFFIAFASDGVFGFSSDSCSSCSG